MAVFDLWLLRLRNLLLKSDAGVRLFRPIRWVLLRLAPYTPPRAEIPPERARAFVKVEIRPSTVRGAGQGLFALERIEAGVTIGEYTGDVVDSRWRAMRLRDRSYLAPTCDTAFFIDALRRPEVMMRYLCHHPRKEKRNAQFMDQGIRKFVVTTRPVDPGEELFIGYGDTYWRMMGISPGEDKV